jgi:valyl-tRNA synthetase
MASLANVVREAGQDLDSYEHSKALEAIETFFWQFCDDYIELVKNRAYGTADATGKVPGDCAVLSARTTLGLGLDAFARLFAPYLPYATEEVWSWMHDSTGSVHRAAWPDAALYEQAAADGDADTLLWAGKALAELRGLKSQAKVSMKTPILSATLLVPASGVQAVKSALNDIAEAGRATGALTVQSVEADEGESSEPAITVIASELGEPPAKKPKH